MNDYMTQPIKCNKYFKITAKHAESGYSMHWLYCVLYQPNIKRDPVEFMKSKCKEFIMHVPHEYQDDVVMDFEELHMYYSEFNILSNPA